KYEPTDVAVYFGEPGKTVPDPFFEGKGPERAGCQMCGGCMLGCRHNAKNTLDKNYLYLAEKLGLEILPQTQVSSVKPDPSGGYRIDAQEWSGWFGKKKRHFFADKVVMSGGVLGTVDLLLKMKQDPTALPNLSPRTGELIRTNSEALIGVVSGRRDL